MKNTPKIELLAPAGNMLKMKTAIFYGADAVYLGIPDFSLRVRINDFDLKGIKAAIEYAHKLKKKVYVTVNIFAHNRHIKLLPKYLKQIATFKADALIISDPGVISLAKKYCPKIAIHLSTQANCTNAAAVSFWQKQGVKRIVLGREVTLAEIKEMHKACPKMELEYFIHGAMCMAYSGRCFLSKEVLGRSANLGDCVQPCRWEYDVSIKAKGHDEVFDLVEEPHGTYLLNSKDLCLIKHVKALMTAGVGSFKIEGRAKSVYYIANLAGIYKEAINHPTKTEFLFKELQEKLVHRGYTTGFLLGDKAAQNISNSNNQSPWEFCGQVTSVEKIAAGKYSLLVAVHNTLKTGDEVEIILPNYDIISLNLQEMIDAKTGAVLAEAHGGGGGQTILLEVNSKKEILPLTVLRRKL